MARCAVCGEPHQACGPSTLATVIPIDERTTLRKESEMGALKRYEVDVPTRRGTHKATLLLSDEDARKQGLLKEAAPKAPPSNEAAVPANKAGQPQATKKMFGRK